MYDKLGLTLYPGTGSMWFLKYQKRWRALGTLLGLGGSAVRCSAPYGENGAEVADEDVTEKDLDRVLSYGSLSLELLLVVLCRGCWATSNRRGLLQDEDAKAAFDKLATGLLQFVPRNLGLIIALDINARRVGDIFVGKHPWCFQLCAGHVDLSDLRRIMPHL